MTNEHKANKSSVVVKTRISQNLKEKLDKLFVDLPNDSAKLRYVVSEYFKFIEKFPYLNIAKETLNPEDAGFLPCDFVKALYDGNELIGFHCSLRKPLPDLPRIKVGRITFKLATPDLCWTCVEVCKKSKLGINPFSHITLESISERKRKYKPDLTRIHIEGTGGRPKVNREEAFKLFALDRPKKFIKNSCEYQKEHGGTLNKNMRLYHRLKKRKYKRVLLITVNNFSFLLF